MNKADMRFEVPDYGTVSGDNAVFTMFLHSLLRHNDKRELIQCRLEDLRIGEEGYARFQSGAGSNSAVIRRVL